MSPRTRFLSRLIGLYCILIALSMMTRRQAIVEAVTVLLQNPSMTVILGVITLAAGLAPEFHQKRRRQQTLETLDKGADRSSQSTCARLHPQCHGVLRSKVQVLKIGRASC